MSVDTGHARFLPAHALNADCASRQQKPGAFALIFYLVERGNSKQKSSW